MPQGFAKILGMMVGELDFEGVQEKTDSDGWAQLLFIVSFLAFVILVGISLINVLIGLAVHDLNVSRQRSFLQYIVQLCWQSALIKFFNSIFEP